MKVQGVCPTGCQKVKLFNSNFVREIDFQVRYL